MKKKVLLTSAIALATASAMTFAPVSYKVIDKASAATASVQENNVEKAAITLKNIFAQMAKEDALVEAYENMTAQAASDIAAFDLNLVGTNLADKLETINPAIDYDVIEGYLKALATQLVVDYASVEGSNFGDLSADLETAIANLNQELEGYISEEINRNDVATFLKEIKDSVLAKIESGDFVGFDFLNEDGGLSEASKQAIKDVLNEQWAREDNTFINALKELYTDKNALLEDVDTLHAAYENSLDEGAQAIYAKGAAALAIGYAKQYFEAKPLISADGNTNKKYFFEIDYDTKLSAVLGAVNWTATTTNGTAIGTVSTETVGDSFEERVVLDLRGESGSKVVTVSAVLDGGFPGIPADFDGVTLFNNTATYNLGSSAGGGGGIVISGDLALVSDYAAKAQAIAGAVDAYLTANPELYNNTLTFGLKHLVEDLVSEALLVQAAGAVNVEEGVSSLNVTPAQMENIYSTQLNTVLDAVKAAFEAKGIELAIDPALIYNIGITANAQVDVSKALIDSLTSKGISTVGVKTGDAVVEIALDQLKASSKVAIKKAASSVAGAKSDAYSISVKDGEGADLTAFEQQYRVTLPVNGTASNVTVAQVTDGSLTLVGGQYDAKAKTITFFTNQLGEFVVVENSASFNDIANIAWAKDQIQFLGDKGLLQGKGNGKFDPNGDVTRAEFTAMLVRAFNLNATADLTFSDVSETAWYHDAISAATAYGIVNGRSASIFDPNAKISREEMATMAANALKAAINYQPASDVDGILGQFVDGSEVVAVHRGNVALIKNEGIIQGKGKNNYDPKGDATRAEAAVILAKLLDRR